jgi:non-ribosomal peptide synthetase component F
MFVNMLALRNYPEGGKTFTTFLEEVKQQIQEAFENQDYPFEDLVDKVVVHRETNRNPLFDCIFALVDTGKDKDESSGTAAAATATFDMTLTAVAAGDDLYFIVRYRTRLFKEEKIKMFADHFKKIVSEVLTNPMVTISEISLTSQKEKEEILSQLTMDLRE